MTERNQTAETILIVVKKLMKWAAIGVVLYFVGFFSLIYLFIHFATSKDEVEVKVVNDMNGVSLNESLGDVLFKKKDYKKENIESQGDSTIENYVIYGDGKYDVLFKDDKAIELNDWCRKIYVEEKGVNGVSCGDSSEKLKSQYKNNLDIYCLKDNSRVYFSVKNNVAYYLSGNEVNRIVVSKELKKQDSWVDCKNFKYKPSE